MQCYDFKDEDEKLTTKQICILGACGAVAVPFFAIVVVVAILLNSGVVEF